MATRSNEDSEVRHGFYRFKKLDDEYIVTNDAGEYVALNEEDFRKLSDGSIDCSNENYEKLKSMGAISGKGIPDTLIERFKRKNFFIFQGPLLFIVIPTLRCNKKCIYCHASAQSAASYDFDMTIETAKSVVDVIFDSPGMSISLEFQGGEPLLNWEAVKFMTNYAIEKNKMHEKKLLVTMVSNLSAIDDEKLDYLVDHKVAISTSLDGPDFIHDKHRCGGHKQLVKNIKKLVGRYSERYGKYQPGALTTITKYSLPYPREIVDTFAGLGLESIHLRPFNPIGFAGPVLEEIGFEPQEFLDFYEKSLDYIIELNNSGTFIVDRTAWLFLVKIFGDFDPNYMDLRSPCGAGIGQVAFNYDGKVYTCDEGRMLSMHGDDTFCMGNVFDNTYDELIGSEIVKQTCLASILDGIPACSSCAYKPYCGVCPLLNYIEEDSMFSKIPNNRRHKINEGILDILFRKLRDEKTHDLFIGWLERGISVI